MDLQHFTFTADSHKLSDYLESLSVTVRAGLHRASIKNQVLTVDGVKPGVDVHSQATLADHDIKGDSVMRLIRVLRSAPHQPITLTLDGFVTINQMTL